MVSAYGENGYELIEIPRAPVEQRTQFVIEQSGITQR